MKKFFKLGWHSLLLSFSLLGLVGCTNPIERLDPVLDRFFPAEELGLSSEITVYTPMNEERTTAYLRLFHQEHPEIEVDLVIMSTGDIISNLLANKDSSEADVIWGLSATGMTQLQWHDVLAPYEPKGVERIYVQFRDTETIPYWVGFGAWLSTICVNMPMLEELGLPRPESWEDLFNPIYVGQVAAPNPTTSGTGYMIIEASFEFFGEVKGWEKLDLLDHNVAVYTTANFRACEMVADGEIPIGLTAEISPIGLREQGKPVESYFLSEGSGWDIEANGLVSKEEVKDAAKTFLDWAISDEAMIEYGQTRSLLAMPLEGYTPPPGFPQEPLKLIFDKNFPWASANRAQILTEWNRRYGAKAEDSLTIIE